MRKRALIYVRVSTQGQAEKTSLDTQEKACREYAEEQGFTVERVSREIFTGAEMFDRPQLARDRQDIRAGLFDAIIILAIDRLSRNIAHLAILDEECRRANCQMLFVLENLDSTPEGKLLQSVRAYVAEVEREKIKERMLRGRRGKLLTGKPVFTGSRLYGYERDRANLRYTINEAEAQVVIRIFSLLVDGRGSHTLASEFNREGLPSPQSSTQRPEAKWSAATVYRIIKNPSYKGEEYAWRTKNDERGQGKAREEKDWIRLPDGIRPPIVSPELWEAANATLKTNTGDRARNAKHPALLRGLIYCATCGNKMIRHYYKRGEYSYLKYRCGSRWRPFATDCEGEGIYLEKADAWAWEECKKIMRDPQIIEEGLRRAQNPEAKRAVKEEASRLRLELQKCESGILRLLRLYRGEEDDVLSVELEAEIRKAKAEKQSLVDRVAGLEARLKTQDNQLTGLRAIRNFCSMSVSELDAFGFERKRQAMNILGLRVRGNGSRLEIELSFLADLTSFSVNPLQVRNKTQQSSITILLDKTEMAPPAEIAEKAVKREALRLELKRLVRETGMKKMDIAKAIGIRATSLTRKLHGQRPVTEADIAAVGRIIEEQKRTD